MEGDWALEIGGNGHVIEALWPGFVDLRAEPEKAAGLTECAELPGLADVLIKLNSASSPVWTSKTDVFVPDQVDHDELDAPQDEAVCFIASYIDVLMRGDQVWNSQLKAEQTCRGLCERLRPIPLRNCRIDLVVRRAIVMDTDELGATIYFTACGRTAPAAKNRLSECLSAFSDIVMPAC